MRIGQAKNMTGWLILIRHHGGRKNERGLTIEKCDSTFK